MSCHPVLTKILFSIDKNLIKKLKRHQSAQLPDPVLFSAHEFFNKPVNFRNIKKSPSAKRRTLQGFHHKFLQDSPVPEIVIIGRTAAGHRLTHDLVGQLDPQAFTASRP